MFGYPSRIRLRPTVTLSSFSQWLEDQIRRRRKLAATIVLVFASVWSVGGCVDPVISGIRTGVSGGVDAGLNALLQEFFADISEVMFPDDAAETGQP